MDQQLTSGAATTAAVAAAVSLCSYLTAKALSIVTAEIELEDHETGERRIQAADIQLQTFAARVLTCKAAIPM